MRREKEKGERGGGGEEGSLKLARDMGGYLGGAVFHMRRKRKKKERGDEMRLAAGTPCLSEGRRKGKKKGEEGSRDSLSEGDWRVGTPSLGGEEEGGGKPWPVGQPITATMPFRGGGGRKKGEGEKRWGGVDSPCGGLQCDLAFLRTQILTFEGKGRGGKRRRGERGGGKRVRPDTAPWARPLGSVSSSIERKKRKKREEKKGGGPVSA